MALEDAGLRTLATTREAQYHSWCRILDPRARAHTTITPSMNLKIVQVGDPVLRQRARPLTPTEIRSSRIQQLLFDMRDTMRNAPGVGLAAPQIGEALQLAVIEDRPEYIENASPERLAVLERSPVPFQVVANPRLTVVTPGTAEFFEGCLSFSGFVGLVPRALEVRVDALNELGEAVTIHARGWYARILQHEIDHLHGVVCIDRMILRTLATSENHTQHWAGLGAEEVRRALDVDRPLP